MSLRILYYTKIHLQQYRNTSHLQNMLITTTYTRKKSCVGYKLSSVLKNKYILLLRCLHQSSVYLNYILNTVQFIMESIPWAQRVLIPQKSVEGIQLHLRICFPCKQVAVSSALLPLNSQAQLPIPTIAQNINQHILLQLLIIHYYINKTLKWEILY